MIAILSMLFSSVFSGGATGLLGIFVQRYFDYQHRNQDLELVKVNNEHARLLSAMETERANRAAEATENVAKTEADAQENVATTDAQAREDEAAAKSLIASYSADKAAYLDAAAQQQSRAARVLMALVDFTRGIIRPALTAYLVGVATVMFFWARKLADQYGAGFTPAQVHDLILQIVSTLLYLVVVAVVWWFGTRPPVRK
jgi:hypothetical protein